MSIQISSSARDKAAPIRRSGPPEGGVPAPSHVPLTALLITNGDAGLCIRMRCRKSLTSACAVDLPAGRRSRACTRGRQRGTECSICMVPSGTTNDATAAPNGRSHTRVWADSHAPWQTGSFRAAFSNPGRQTPMMIVRSQFSWQVPVLLPVDMPDRLRPGPSLFSVDLAFLGRVGRVRLPS